MKGLEKQAKKKNKLKNRNETVAADDTQDREKCSHPPTDASNVSPTTIIGLGLPNPPSIVDKFSKEFAEAIKRIEENELPCIKKTISNGRGGRTNEVICKPLWGNQLNYFQDISTALGYIIAYERGDLNWDWTNDNGNLSPPLFRLMHALDKRTTRIFNQMTLCLFGVLPPKRRKASSASSTAVITTNVSLSSSARINDKEIAAIFGDSDDDTAESPTLAPVRDVEVDLEASNTHKKKKKRKSSNYEEEDSCEDAIPVENLAKVMRKHLDEITRVKVAERHVFDLLKGELLSTGPGRVSFIMICECHCFHRFAINQEANY